MSILDISKKDHQCIPQDLNQQPLCVQALIARQCGSTRLTTFINFSQLIYLDLSNNRLSCFVKSSSLSGLFLLKALILRQNEIQVINKEFFSLAKTIEFLDLSQNQISKCSVSLLQLTNLETYISLSLNANKIEDLQSFKCFKVDTLLKLKHIGLLDNPIEKFEESLLYYFPNLEFVLTKFCSQKDRNQFDQISKPNYYIRQSFLSESSEQSFDKKFKVQKEIQKEDKVQKEKEVKSPKLQRTPLKSRPLTPNKRQTQITPRKQYQQQIEEKSFKPEMEQTIQQSSFFSKQDDILNLIDCKPEYGISSCPQNKSQDIIYKSVSNIPQSARKSRQSSVHSIERRSKDEILQDTINQKLIEIAKVKQNIKKLETNGIHETYLNYQNFLKLLLDGEQTNFEAFEMAMSKFSKFAVSIDFFDQQKNKELVLELVRTLQKTDVDAQLELVQQLIDQIGRLNQALAQ